MDAILEDVTSRLGISDQVEPLREAADFSQSILDSARDFLTAAVPCDNEVKVDVVLFGSYARFEASLNSDFDFLIVSHALAPAAHVRCTRELLGAIETMLDNAEMFQGIKRPGPSQLFGDIQSASDLVERIGLEHDTNSTHTRRALLMQESHSVYNPALHRELLRSTLTRYLIDYEGTVKAGPPRFLINDLNRYWFTVAVDYQAKRWQRNAQGWGIRYLKLLVTRRLSYVGAVLPLLRCGPDNPATVDGILDAYSHPALARVADIANHQSFNQLEALSRVLAGAARFNEILSDDEAREVLDGVSAQPKVGEIPVFDEMMTLGKQIGDDLRTILHDSSIVNATVRYLLL